VATISAQLLQNPRQRTLLRRRLLAWYDANKRDLPWRENRDPYRVWISEIMLQQTRVAAVIEYYARFLKRFPDVQTLAGARLDSVLAAWSGLGYYRRARMLHQAARKIVHDYGGIFPTTANGWHELPGIGRYTSAAIASIAFDEPVAVVDGNVERVLSRLAGKNMTAKEAWSVADALLSRTRPGDFNQAMMELGATVCVPGEPKCLTCPLVEVCATRGPMPSEAKPQRLSREVCYALNAKNGSLLLVRRPANVSLMAGMWELPEVTSPNGDHLVEFIVRHSITVTDYVVRVTSGTSGEVPDAKWIAKSRLKSLPLTGLTKKILRRAGVI